MKKEEWRMMKEDWRMMKKEWRMKNYEGWMMKDDDFKLLNGFALGRTNGQTFAIVESLLRLKIIATILSNVKCM